MSDLIGCFIKLVVLAGLLIFGFFYWLLIELVGIESGISFSQFAFFVLGVIVLFGLLKKK